MDARKMRSVLGAAVLLAVQPMFAAPDVPIQDLDPYPTDWEGARLATSSNLLGLPAVLGLVDGGGILQANSQGAPQSACTTSCTTATTVYDLIFLGDSYSPASEGAILGIDLSVLLKGLPHAEGDPHTSTGRSVFLAFRQGGETYWTDGALATVSASDPDWENATATFDVDGASYKHIADGELPAVNGGPNFVNGSTIEFGLVLSISTGVGEHTNPLIGDDHDEIRVIPLGVDDFDLTLLRSDIDIDGVADQLDNCVSKPNAPSLDCDTDNDGYGNVCDGDFDQNWAVNATDFNTKFVPDFKTATDSGYGTDMDCNGSVNATDFNQYYTPSFNYSKPGPSGLSCAGTVPCPDL